MKKRPNIIWILGDQHRAQALGTMGDENVSTPNIDSLAVDGITFENAVSGCPLCCPYRGSLISGRYPHRSVPGHQIQLPPELLTVAQPFRGSGYDTSYFGKWHLDGFQEREGRAVFHEIPRERRGGFDSWVGYENNNSQYDSWVHGHVRGEKIDQYRLEGYETDSLTDLFMGHIESTAVKREPFFSVLSVQPPHNPYVSPSNFMSRYSPARIKLRPNVPDVRHITDRARRELAGYYAMIENLDWNVGRIVETLRRLEIYDDTHIVFFSDHGDMHGSHGQFLKTSPWEEAIRVPCIIGGGRRYEMKAGNRVDAPINHVDMAPTSLGLCGIEVPDWMSGTDYSHYRLGNSSNVTEPDSAFLQLVVPTGHADSIDRPWRGVVTRDRWKYVVLKDQPWMMFDLDSDPYEFVNLVFNSRYRRERTRLHERLATWINETDDVFDLPVF